MNRDEEQEAESKEVLQRRMEEARNSIEATVSAIKETVEDRVKSVKKTLGGVAELRHQFEKEPIVWSLGTLAAGFALGYTLGYAHKGTKGKPGKRSEVRAFADAIVGELSGVGNDLIMPRLNENISHFLGIDFPSVLAEIKKSGKKAPRRAPVRASRKPRPLGPKRRSKKR